MRRKIFLATILSAIISIGCANHKYLVSKSETTRKSETYHLRIFTLWWFVPIYNDLDRKNVCPNSKIRMINMHTNLLGAVACGSTAFLFCPHTVGVECE
ncbi:hypothetical protein CH371_01155 [Leptospira wolffii]|uniref:Lipoprotein n=1 Tax=Leptospira wolffii TaxID=409998 RepID=A0A2M9ZE96_9LEPT|nr:hypothetical protein [Leptospira wolffii]PJZ66743.1 hypothetical protein CH371_01155 [Leptospira wolffii]